MKLVLEAKRSRSWPLMAYSTREEKSTADIVINEDTVKGIVRRRARNRTWNLMWSYRFNIILKWSTLASMPELLILNANISYMGGHCFLIYNIINQKTYSSVSTCLINITVRRLECHKRQAKLFDMSQQTFISKAVSHEGFNNISQLWHVDTSFPHISWELALQLSSLFWLPLCSV